MRKRSQISSGFMVIISSFAVKVIWVISGILVSSMDGPLGYLMGEFVLMCNLGLELVCMYHGLVIPFTVMNFWFDTFFSGDRLLRKCMSLVTIIHSSPIGFIWWLFRFFFYVLRSWLYVFPRSSNWDLEQTCLL